MYLQVIVRCGAYSVKHNSIKNLLSYSIVSMAPNIGTFSCLVIQLSSVCPLFLFVEVRRLVQPVTVS